MKTAAFYWAKAQEKYREMKYAKKGSMQAVAVGGLITFVIVAVILSVMYPILSGVTSATTVISNTTALGLAQQNNIAGIASGAAILNIVELIIAAVIVLGIIMTLSHKRGE
jgi:hypothetical protein